jgi:hypothetical protein
VFYKRRVRLDPEHAGLRLEPAALRGRVLETLLRADGVEAVRCRPVAGVVAWAPGFEKVWRSVTAK